MGEEGLKSRCETGPVRQGLGQHGVEGCLERPQAAQVLWFRPGLMSTQARTVTMPWARWVGLQGVSRSSKGRREGEKGPEDAGSCRGPPREVLGGERRSWGGAPGPEPGRGGERGVHAFGSQQAGGSGWEGPGTPTGTWRGGHRVGRGVGRSREGQPG